MVRVSSRIKCPSGWNTTQKQGDFGTIPKLLIAKLFLPKKKEFWAKERERMWQIWQILYKKSAQKIKETFWTAIKFHLQASINTIWEINPHILRCYPIIDIFVDNFTLVTVVIEVLWRNHIIIMLTKLGNNKTIH